MILYLVKSINLRCNEIISGKQKSSINLQNDFQHIVPTKQSHFKTYILSLTSSLHRIMPLAQSIPGPCSYETLIQHATALS